MIATDVSWTEKNDRYWSQCRWVYSMFFFSVEIFVSARFTERNEPPILLKGLLMTVVEDKNEDHIILLGLHFLGILCCNIVMSIGRNNSTILFYPCGSKLDKNTLYAIRGSVTQAARRSPPTARVPSSRLGHSIWISW